VCLLFFEVIIYLLEALGLHFQVLDLQQAKAMHFVLGWAAVMMVTVFCVMSLACVTLIGSREVARRYRELATELAIRIDPQGNGE
jgi:hypothetical protein